ncbi:hypothetical protein ACWCPT_32160 [Streptomyces sp. NPDC002308]
MKKRWASCAGTEGGGAGPQASIPYTWPVKRSASNVPIMAMAWRAPVLVVR